MQGVRIASAAEIGGAARLEGVWLRAFGAGDRPLGWFARKLARERVDDELSQVAIATDGDPRSPRSWLGFVLAGRLPSQGDVVRTAGTAVVREARGRGVGALLLHALQAAAARAGSDKVQLVADATAIHYYERLGFVRIRDVATLRIDATGAAGPLPPPLTWDEATAALAPSRQLSAWTPEAWEGSTDRHALALRSAAGRRIGLALASREGGAWLVHRWLADPRATAPALVAALAASLPAASPILVPHVDADEVSSITDSAATSTAPQNEDPHAIEIGTAIEIPQRGALLVRSATSAAALHAAASRR